VTGLTVDRGPEIIAKRLQLLREIVPRGKDPASPYRGDRTLSWLKVKQRDYRIEERGGDNRK
jgi:hypothetical protein